MRKGGKVLRVLGVLAIVGLLTIVTASPVLAYIDGPDNTPSVEDIYCYRNVLETGDFLVIVYENMPYDTYPGLDYSEAFVWRWMENDGTTEIAQAMPYDYNEYGYGYNVISFYLDADDAPEWDPASPYKLKLSGLPSAFEDPESYFYTIEDSSYSSLTDTDDVKAAIASQILTLANDLDNKWGLSVTYSLLSESEVGSVLSVYGEAFFRGAIYGVQSMAPGAFSLVINDITSTDRDWDTEYLTLLDEQYEGTYIDTAMTAGNELLEVDYNLMGLLGVAAICLLIIFANWYVAGGNLWRGVMDSAAPLVIGGRLALIGLGEVGLVVAMCWLYVSAKLWRIV